MIEDEQVLQTYRTTRSVYLTATGLHMSTQRVRRVLNAANEPRIPQQFPGHPQAPTHPWKAGFGQRHDA